MFNFRHTEYGQSTREKHTQDLNHNVVSILIIEINIQFQKLVMLTREHFFCI